jgi:Flp pilus assembly protein TadG
MIRARLGRLATDSDGVSAVEFALIAPVLLMMVMGIFDLGHNMYTTSMLQGAIQQSARNSTIEGAASNPAALDAIVTTAVRAISPNSTLQFSRAAYTNFSDMGQAEDYTDLDNDDNCNNGEPYEDANGNGQWDTDQGIAGQGGARDAVMYTVKVSYPRMFPIARLIPGQTDTFTMQSQTVLRNQPYGLQRTDSAATGNCP